MKKSPIVYILHAHDGISTTWRCIHKNQIKKWKEDGSLKEGDLIIYPKETYEIKLKKIIQMVKK